MKLFPLTFSIILIHFCALCNSDETIILEGFIIDPEIEKGYLEDHKEEKSIGSVKMQEDGTLVFHLRAESMESEVVGDAMIIVKKTNEEYKSMLEHVSPIKPGEEKLVKPWKE